MNFYDENDHASVEKYSSAITLSDMEIFIFPDLLYSLVLANLMSPLPWEWRNNDWFQKSQKLNEHKKLLRLRQFIMDNFIFNLDLVTWGLTSKEREFARFDKIVNEDFLKLSSPLFGYTGDKYYFDLHIRKHFGLSNYDENIIPYWKTETIEAMNAFRFKEGYTTGAGECVSFLTMYAALLHTCIGVPLDKIYLIGTLLHGQNFIDLNDGILTNNRRLVTKNMWFNGSEISAKARRALENEDIMIISHQSGYIHKLYETASIQQEAYNSFSKNLSNFLSTSISPKILAAFLRHYKKYQSCFLFERFYSGNKYYIEAEKAFDYENCSKGNLGDKSQNVLLKEIEIDEFYPDPIPGRAIFNDLQKLLQEQEIDLVSPTSVDQLRKLLPGLCLNLDEFLQDLNKFSNTTPKLPSEKKHWISYPKIDLSNCQSHTDVINYLSSIREINPVADLAFAAYRDLNRTPWKPFLKAALERSPVSLVINKTNDLNSAYQLINTFENQSIYDSTRLAQPDEVYNFKRGDGLEKALLFLNLILDNKTSKIEIDCKQNQIEINYQNQKYNFITNKINLNLAPFIKEIQNFI